MLREINRLFLQTTGERNNANAPAIESKLEETSSIPEAVVFRDTYSTKNVLRW